MNRFKTRRLDELEELLTHREDYHRLRGEYIDIACVFETPSWLCAVASRLSHESQKRSTPETDAALMARLEAMGDEHAKGARAKIFYVLIEAPRYFWAEMDTYTVGVQSLGSTSTMHKEAKGLKGEALVELKSNLPEGTLQLRMKSFSYLALKRMAAQRDNHRLPEWGEFCKFVEQYIKL
jgi:hypothetical protein